MVNNLILDTDIDWKVSPQPVPYPDAIQFMEQRVNEIIAGKAAECVWLLEHPPLYTAGTSAKQTDLLIPDRFPVYQTGRGGEFTYHGPGQRIIYIMLDLNKRRKDVRWFIEEIEGWIIEVCAEFGINAETREGRVGLWVTHPDASSNSDHQIRSKGPGGMPGREEKIAALGIRMRRWVSFHGASLNLNPELEHFNGIVPCGIKEHGVTSFSNLEKEFSTDQVDEALRRLFHQHF